MPTLYFLTFRADLPLGDALFALLPEDVQQRCARIKWHEQAKAAGMGQLLVRYALSCEAACRPEEIAIERMPSGKPYSPNLGLAWNLSHTAGAAAVCVDLAPVGVDVERIGPLRRRVLERAFSEREQAYVLSAPEGQDSRFFEVWTRKEAAAKRDGRGLSSHLQDIDAFSDTFGAFTTLREGAFIVSVSAEKPLDGQSILRLDENMLTGFFQNP